MPTGRGGHRGPRIRDDTWRHLTASVPGRLVDDIDEEVGKRQRSQFVREACEAELARRRDAHLTALEASHDLAPYTPDEEPARA